MLEKRFTRVGAPIGDGTYGVVFKGMDHAQPTPTPVAIKVPKHTRASGHAGILCGIFVDFISSHILHFWHHPGCHSAHLPDRNLILWFRRVVGNAS